MYELTPPEKLVFIATENNYPVLHYWNEQPSNLASWCINFRLIGKSSDITTTILNEVSKTTCSTVTETKNLTKGDFSKNYFKFY